MRLPIALGAALLSHLAAAALLPQPPPVIGRRSTVVEIRAPATSAAAPPPSVVPAVAPSPDRPPAGRRRRPVAPAAAAPAARPPSVDPPPAIAAAPAIGVAGDGLPGLLGGARGAGPGGVFTVGGDGPPRGEGGSGASAGQGPSRGPERGLLLRAIRARIEGARHYPEIARRRGVEGRVLLRFQVGADGRAHQLVVLRGADPLLDEAALAAVEEAAPLPAIDGRVEVELSFVLDDGAS